MFSLKNLISSDLSSGKVIKCQLPFSACQSQHCAENVKLKSIMAGSHGVGFHISLNPINEKVPKKYKCIY
jgi:hypothetical protein